MALSVNRPRREFWLVTALLTAIRLVLVLGLIMPVPLLPAIASSLALPIGVTGQLVTAMTGAGAMAAVLSGPVVDRYGREPFLTWGMLAMGISSFAFALSRVFILSLAIHMVFGAALTLIWVATLSYIGDYYPYERRGMAMGVTGTAVGAASILGAVSGLAMAETIGWQWAYVMMGGMCLLIALATMRYVPRLTKGRHLSAGIMRTYISSFRELFTIRMALVLLGASAIFHFAHQGFNTYFPSWLTNVFALTPAGLMPVVVVSGLASIIGGPLSGLLSDRFGKKTVLIPSLLLSAVTMGLLQLAGDTYSQSLVLYTVVSFATIFINTSLIAWMTNVVPDLLRGTLMALLVTVQRGATALAAGVGGWFFETTGFETLALIAAGLVMVALLTFQLLGREPARTLAVDGPSNG